MCDVPLDTVVRLLAEAADLQLVRIDNVLFVTTEERAARLQNRSTQAATLPSAAPIGGFNMMPMGAGMPGAGGADWGGFDRGSKQVTKKKAADSAPEAKSA